MNELKPCPFCGAEPELESEKFKCGKDEPEQEHFSIYQTCDCLECTTDWYFDKQQGIDTWNNRVAEKRIKELEDVVRYISSVEDMLFAECTQAEDIINKCKNVLKEGEVK